MGDEGWIKIRDLHELRRHLLVRVKDKCGRSSLVLLKDPRPNYNRHVHSFTLTDVPCRTPDMWAMQLISSCCAEHDQYVAITRLVHGTPDTVGCLGLAVARGLAYRLPPEEDKQEDAEETKRPVSKPRARETVDAGAESTGEKKRG